MAEEVPQYTVKEASQDADPEKSSTEVKLYDSEWWTIVFIF